MVRKRFRCRPEFESLDSRLLLSGPPGLEHPGVPAVIEARPKVSHRIVLTGSAIGRYHFQGGLGAPMKFSMAGAIKPFGRVTLQGSILVSLPDPYGQATITTGHGKVFVNLNQSAPGIVFTYTITGGTKKWANASGTGEAIVSTVPSRGRNTSHGHVAITFVILPT
jgi:hypothetical protein